ncbi:MAG: hypothetical protein WBX38_01885 [Candidatus Sulfotelmatobacter sp.]
MTTNRAATFALFFFLSAVLLTSVPSWAAAKDACSLITSDDAQAALGEPVGLPKSRPRSMAGADGSNCQYRSTQGSALKAKSVSLTVGYSSSDISGNENGMMENLKSAGYKNVRQISGVGSSAVWGTNSMMDRPTGELSVLKGKNIMLIIIIDGIADEPTALDRAKALAAKVLPKA